MLARFNPAHWKLSIAKSAVFNLLPNQADAGSSQSLLGFGKTFKNH
jgi:hypothetical protein